MDSLRNSTSYHSLADRHKDDQIGNVSASQDTSFLPQQPPQYEPETPSPRTWAAKCRAFTRWALTPLGFLITVYGLNIIAWGGMLFLLLCNAAPQMCNPDCNSPDSARRIWIEIDSQILNALFCVTGFGLAPWRIRDLYMWGCWRFGCGEENRERGFDRLAKVHANWYHRGSGAALLPGPVNSNGQEGGPERGYATPTPGWKLDVAVWGNILNTVFQTCLAVCMWALNRFNRPSWTTGLFVCLACVAAAVPGILMWLEKKRVKKASEHPGALLLVPHSVNG